MTVSNTNDSKQELGPNQREWVDDLLSGKFKQCDSHLQYLDSFCCLGVSCMTAAKNKVEIEINSNDGELVGSTLSRQQKVMDWLALRDTEGDFSCYHSLHDEINRFIQENFNTVEEEVDSLTGMNDVLSLSFSQIAEVVEAFPQAFFGESK